jgi:hypothetical protein
MPPASVTFKGWSVRPQTTQPGTASAPPRAASSATSRPTVGGAPRDSAVGCTVSAAARLRSVAGRSATTASTASATTRRGSLTPAAVTCSITALRRHSGQCRPAGRFGRCRHRPVTAAAVTIRLPLDPGPAGPGTFRRCRRRGPLGGHRLGELDQIAGLAVQDVAQRGQRGQVQPLRHPGHQPVDLLPGQLHAALCQRGEQVRGREHAPLGHPGP